MKVLLCPHCRQAAPVKDFYIDNRAGMMRRDHNGKIEMATTVACPYCHCVFVDPVNAPFSTVADPEDEDSIKNLNLKSL